MDFITFLLIMLFIFIVLTFVFLTFNIINPRKFITYISMSHLLGVVTVVTYIIVSTDMEKYKVLGLFVTVAFLWSNFIAIIALLDLVNVNINKRLITAAILVTIIDVILAATTDFGMTIVHKFFLSTCYIILGYKFYKEKKVSTAYKVIISSLILFPCIQYYYGIVGLLGINVNGIIGLAAYVLQSVTLSIAVILASYEETNNMLQNNLENMRFITENIGDMICELDNEFKVIYATDSFKKVLGYKPEELLNRSIKDIIHKEDYPGVEACMRSFAGSNLSMKCEHRLIGKFNSELYVQTLINRTVEDNEAKYILCLRDISKEKYLSDLEVQFTESQDQLNRAYELDKVKTEFFANVSHDLRTPINILFSSIQLYEVYFDDRENHEENVDKMNSYLKVMRQNCCRLIKLVNNLIDVSRIESNFMKLNLTYCDIVSITEDISISTVPYAEERGIYIEFDPEFEEKLIMCDIDILERVLLNLIANAIKFSNKGGVIRINLSEKDNFIVISVKDQGIGIPESMKEKVFERFLQVSEDSTSAKEGSGIGLCLVKGLIEMQGGTIDVISEVNKGSEFIFTLPIVEKTDSYDEHFITELNAKKIEIEFSDL
ncbi:MAG: ATP-binding protein [Clostridiaceae bacterium]